MSAVDVVLVSMPFERLSSPSLALGLLHGGLARQGTTVCSMHFKFDFVRRFGELFYREVSSGLNTPDLVGEWLFSHLLGDDRADARAERYTEQVLRGKHPAHDAGGAKPYPEGLIKKLLDTRTQLQDLIDASAEQVLSRSPRIVGLTSVFQQHTASLALARALRARSPDVLIVMGGANCEGAMGAETLRQFQFVDAVVSGEGDLVFPLLVSRVLAGEPWTDIQGVFTRSSGHNPHQRTPIVTDMDALAPPDFDDFFAQWEQAELTGPPSLPFETSRGCWWGQRIHCTFCGLNGGGMAFRSKSAESSLVELSGLVERYGVRDIMMADNIMDHRYFRAFLPKLRDAGLRLKVFYEIKANITKEQLRLLRDAGVTTVQPGIESLSSQVLAVMRKGSRATHNLQLLKWSRELGVSPIWAMIWGFPGEDPDEYTRLAALIPHLTHLPSPKGGFRIRLDRFSPNFEQAADVGFTNVRPYPSYSLIYGLSSEANHNLAYFFDYDGAPPSEEYCRPVSEAIEHWRSVHQESELVHRSYGDYLLLADTRPGHDFRVAAIAGLARDILIRCDAVCGETRLREQLFSTHPAAKDSATWSRTLSALIEHGWLYREDHALLTLSVSGDEEPMAGAGSSILDAVVEGFGGAETVGVVLSLVLDPAQDIHPLKHASPGA